MQHLVHGEIGHPHGPVTEFPVKTIWALLDLKVAEDQRSWRRCRCFRRFVKRYPHQTRQAFAVHVQRPAARRAETDRFWQYFHGAAWLSPAATTTLQLRRRKQIASAMPVPCRGLHVSRLYQNRRIQASPRKKLRFRAARAPESVCTRESHHHAQPLKPTRRYNMKKPIKEAIRIMKPKQIFISILAVLFVFPLMGTFAQQAPNSGSIEVITTFDYPGTGIVTTSPQKINDRGDIVGEFIDSSGVVRGFVRFSDGSFSAPIVDPNDTVGFTEGRGINNLGTVCGDYAISDGNNHGFFLSGGTFTEYDVPGAP